MALDITGQYRHPSPNAAWLSVTREEIIEPSLPILDAHHHIWEQSGNFYGMDDLEADLATGHRIVATIFVQCYFAYRTDGPELLRPVGETETIEKLLAARPARAGAPELCAAIVGFADLCLGARVAEVLDAHLAASPGRFRGVRQSAARDPVFPNGIVMRPAPEGMLGWDKFREGLREVARRGLSFDSWIFHCQIPELAALADAVPDARIVLDHFGGILGVGPYRGRERETFETWRRHIGELARRPNVCIKLGGLGMIMSGGTYHERAAPPGSVELAEWWRPYVEASIEAFGVQRCMFESNFPVDKGMFSYPVMWNAFKRLTAGASAAEKAALFHDTAAAVYRVRHLGV